LFFLTQIPSCDAKTEICLFLSVCHICILSN
jgi:hypothetical protein